MIAGGRGTSAQGGQTGAVLLLVVVSLALAGLVSAGIWRLGAWSWEGAVSERSALGTQLLAEGAVRLVTQRGVRPPGGLALGGAVPWPALVPDPRSSARLELQRWGRELFVLRAEATVDGQAGPAVGALMWALDPGGRLSSWPAVLSSQGTPVPVAGAVVVDSVATAFAAQASLCAPMQPLVDSLFPTGRTPAFASDTTAGARLGLLDLASLAGRADRVVAGPVGTPSPGAGGCGGGPWNWGDPAAPASCPARPLIHATGDLTLAGGTGQGTLIGAGDVHLRAGAEFHGVIAAAGDVVVEGGATLHGFVRAGGSVRVGPGGHVRASACAALLALAHPNLRLVRPVSDGWVEPI